MSNEYPIKVEWHGTDKKMIFIKETYLGKGIYCDKKDVELLIRQLGIVYSEMEDM